MRPAAFVTCGADISNNPSSVEKVIWANSGGTTSLIR